MGRGIGDNIQNVTKKVEEFSLNTAEYYKLRLFKSSTKGAISLINFLVTGIILLLVLIFISLGMGIWLGAILESPYAGFFIVGGFYIVVMICVKIFAKSYIENILLIRFSDLFYDEFDPNVEDGSSITNKNVAPPTKQEFSSTTRENEI